jgi:carbon monoxide dehydrogenase subunit G
MPRLVSTTEAIELSAPREEVWALVSDVSRYAEWVHGTVEVTGGPATARAGVTYAERNRLGPLITRSTWRVELADADAGVQRHVSSGSPGIRSFAVVISVDPARSGTRFVLTLEAEVAAGPLTRPLARVLHRTLAASNARSAAAFAELCANGARAGIEP